MNNYITILYLILTFKQILHIVTQIYYFPYYKLVNELVSFIKLLYYIYVKIYVERSNAYI